MWPHGGGPRHFRKMAEGIVGTRRTVLAATLGDSAEALGPYPGRAGSSWSKPLLGFARGLT